MRLEKTGQLHAAWHDVLKNQDENAEACRRYYELLSEVRKEVHPDKWQAFLALLTKDFGQWVKDQDVPNPQLLS